MSTTSLLTLCLNLIVLSSPSDNIVISGIKITHAQDSTGLIKHSVHHLLVTIQHSKLLYLGQK